MRNRKILPIIIISILIVLIGGGIACAYFFTDIFRTDRELFMKYISKNTEIIENLKDEDYEQYTQKLLSMPYTNSGEIKETASNVALMQGNTLKDASNVTMTFNGSVDKANKYAYQNIKINYSATQSMSYHYVHKQDIYAIKVDDVVNKYIGIENNNLQQFAQKLGVPEDYLSIIPNKIDENMFNNIITKEEIEGIINKYYNVAIQSLTDDMFSKGENADGNIYTLTLNEEQIKQLAIKLMETLKDDEAIYTKAKNIMFQFKVSEEDANKYIEQIKSGIQQQINTLSEKESSSDEKPIIINVYVNKNNIQKTEICIDDYKILVAKNENGISLQELKNNETIYSYDIEKIKGEDELTYKISNKSEEQTTYTYTIKGIKTLNSVEETYTQSNSEKNTVYTSTKTFTDSVQNDISDDNIMLINQAPNINSLQSLYEQISDKSTQVDSSRIKDAGLQSSNLEISNQVSNYFNIYICAEMMKNPKESVTAVIPVMAGLAINMYEGTNSLLNMTQQQSDEEADMKERIVVKVMDIYTNILTDVYSNGNVNRKEEITLQDLQQGLTDMNVSVVENQDGTFTITENETGAVVIINSKGEVQN